MHARKHMQTDRQTNGCMRACRMYDYIYTYRQTGARRTACAHTRTNAYVRTHIHTYLLFVWFDSLRSCQQCFSMSDGRIFLGWSSTKQGLMGLAQRHNTVTPVRLEPAALRSRVKHSTTEPLRSTYIHTWATPQGRAFLPKVLLLYLKKCKDDFNFVVLTAYVLGNCLDQDQAQNNVGSDLDPNCLTVW